MTRRVKIIVFSLIGASALGVFACGGLIFWALLGLRELPKAMSSADAFMDQLGAGRVDSAYNETARTFKAKVSLDDLRAVVAKYPAFTNPSRRTMGAMRIMQMRDGPHGFIQYNLANANNTLTLVGDLVNEDGAWKVQSVNFP